MTRFLVLVLVTALTALGTEVTSPSASPDKTTLVTFNKDVLPILQKNCQICHRPNGVAPMSLTTFESARPWAKAIKTEVLSKRMPPWFADPHVGEFRNAPQLTPADVKTIAAWVDGGAPEGNLADKPSPVEWTDGWRIQPDVVVEMPQAQRIAARGQGEIKQFIIPSPFKEDTWVSSIEIRPGDPSVVHHVMLQVPEQTGARPFAAVHRIVGPEQGEAVVQEAAVLRNKLDGLAVIGNQRGGGAYSDVMVRLQERETGRGAFTTMEAIYAPGSQPLDFRYPDSAKLIKGGKPLRLEVHYTPNGKATMDKTMVGFTLAKAPAQRRFVIMAPEHLVDDRVPIPAGEANFETRGMLTFNQDADLVWFMPHMHLRGKDMTFRLIHPDGREQDVLSANFNFHWQLGYELKEPIHVTKGTRLEVVAHHDNSANNPSNPSPGQPVVWGEMTSQEMMLPWFGVVVDRDATPDMIATYRPPNLDGPLPGFQIFKAGAQAH